MRGVITTIFVVAFAGLGCSDVECDATTELHVTFGSDVTGKGDSEDCEPLPEACGDTPTCECLEGQTLASGHNADFCLMEGSCTVTDGTVHLTCPGG